MPSGSLHGLKEIKAHIGFHRLKPVKSLIIYRRTFLSTESKPILLEKQRAMLQKRFLLYSQNLIVVKLFINN